MDFKMEVMGFRRAACQVYERVNEQAYSEDPGKRAALKALHKEAYLAAKLSLNLAQSLKNMAETSEQLGDEDMRKIFEAMNSALIELGTSLDDSESILDTNI